MQLLAHDHGGRWCTQAQAIHRLQCDRAIGGGAALGIQSAASVLPQFVRPHGLACLGAANLDHLFARRFMPKEMIKGHYTMHFSARQIEFLGNQSKSRRWYMTQRILNVVKHGKQSTRQVLLAIDARLDDLLLRFCQHGGCLNECMRPSWQWVAMYPRILTKVGRAHPVSVLWLVEARELGSQKNLATVMEVR